METKRQRHETEALACYASLLREKQREKKTHKQLKSMADCPLALSAATRILFYI